MASFASANGLVDDQNYWHSRMTPVKLVLQTSQTGRAISSNYGAVIEVAGLRLVLPCRTLSMFGTLSVPELSVFPLHVIFVLHLHCNLDAREVVGLCMHGRGAASSNSYAPMFLGCVREVLTLSK